MKRKRWIFSLDIFERGEDAENFKLIASREVENQKKHPSVLEHFTRNIHGNDRNNKFNESLSHLSIESLFNIRMKFSDISVFSAITETVIDTKRAVRRINVEPRYSRT